ncbi:MAG: four helix bundle protein [Balneola sp.]
MRKYKDLKIWQRSVELATVIYEATSEFPQEEKYGLISQMRRCAVSIPSNIAEGAGRSSDKEYSRFLEIAYGSSYELETQLTISHNLNLIAVEKFTELSNEINEIQKMIYSLNKKLKD